jgi:hypothetical protein
MPVKTSCQNATAILGLKELPKIWIVLMDLQQQFVILIQEK